MHVLIRRVPLFPQPLFKMVSQHGRRLRRDTTTVVYLADFTRFHVQWTCCGQGAPIVPDVSVVLHPAPMSQGAPGGVSGYALQRFSGPALLPFFPQQALRPLNCNLDIGSM